jgi:hypothetical protein
MKQRCCPCRSLGKGSCYTLVNVALIYGCESGGAIKAKAEIVDGQMTTAPIIYVISNISLMSNLNRGSFDLSDIRPMRHLGDT